MRAAGGVAGGTEVWAGLQGQRRGGGVRTRHPSLCPNHMDLEERRTTPLGCLPKLKNRKGEGTDL